MSNQPFTGFLRTRVVEPEWIAPGKTCPNCGSALFIKQACCGWAKAGWQTVLRCVRSGCAFTEGLEREK